MLKPKKKLTKRELRRDPLLESIEKVKSYLEENSTRLLYGVGGVVVVILLAWGWNNSRESARIEAQLANTRVTAAYMNGVNGDVLSDLETVVAQYGDTHQASQSKYYLAVSRADSGDAAGARTLLMELVEDTDDPLLQTGAAVRLAELEEQSENYGKAGDWYMRAAGFSSPSIAEAAKIHAAYAYYYSVNPQECQRILDEIMAGEPQGTRKEEVEYLEGMLAGK